MRSSAWKLRIPELSLQGKKKEEKITGGRQGHFQELSSFS